MMGILSGVKRLEFAAILVTCVTIPVFPIIACYLFAGDNGPRIECHTNRTN